MKILNKIILIALFFTTSFNTQASTLPPFSDSEVKSYAEDLMDKGLYKRAGAYYNESKKRGDVIDSVWNLSLIDISLNNNKEALSKLDYLSNQENIDTKAVMVLRSKVLLKLAEENIYLNNYDIANLYISNYYRSQRTDKLDKLAKKYSNKLQKNNDLKRSINIGVVLPLSGKLSKIGQQIKNSLKLALFENQIKNVNLYFEDNKSNQDGSIDAARTILRHSPSIVIGPILRDNILAANTIFESAGIPVFAFSNDKSIAGDNIFLNSINIQQEASEIARIAVDDKKLTLSCLTPNTSLGDIEEDSFIFTAKSYKASIKPCTKFDSKSIDISKSIKSLIDLDSVEKKRKEDITALEKEFAILGNAMDDDKITLLEELKSQEDVYSTDFQALFIPVNGVKMPIIAPQLAFYDVDFTNGVMYLGDSAWDTDALLSSRGEHLHFSRFLSLKSLQFKDYAKRFKGYYNSQPTNLAGFAYDMLQIISSLDYTKSVKDQIYARRGFSVLTGNVRFLTNNMPHRVYGLNKISRRKIKPVIAVSHIRPVQIPNKRSIMKDSGLGGWFGF